MTTAVDNEQDQELSPDLLAQDVPMSEAAPDADADFNATPPPLPELKDEHGKAVPYIVDLMLGRNGIQKQFYDEKDQQTGEKTGKKGVYFTIDLLTKAVAPADGREMDLAFFNQFLQPAQRPTTFVKKGKGLSEFVHIAKIAGLDPSAYTTVGELAQDLGKVLREKQKVQALAYTQWQWWSKEESWTTGKGEAKKGKVVRYGMTNADTKREDGSYSGDVLHKSTGETIRGRATIIKLEPLA